MSDSRSLSRKAREGRGCLHALCTQVDDSPSSPEKLVHIYWAFIKDS